MSHKPGYARGINNTQRVRLLALHESGSTPEEISDILRVDVDIVENWIPGAEEGEEKPKRKRRTKVEMEAARAEEEQAEE